jgi:hypothetical protein
VDAENDGPHAVVVRYSNPEQVPATHYNPNPMARHADLSVNGGEVQRVLFAPTFHRNSFWERTIVLDLDAGENTITFSAEEQPNVDGVTYAAENWPGIPLRAKEAPIIDRITVSPFSAVPEPALDVQVEVTTKCQGGKVRVTASAVNGEEVPVDLTFTSEFGTKTIDDAQPGKQKSHTFSTGTAETPAGEIVVTARAGRSARMVG